MFENLHGPPHVIFRPKTMINAAVDPMDNDGIPEIALAYGIRVEPGPRRTGNIADPRTAMASQKLHGPQEIDRMPAAHRVVRRHCGERAQVLVAALFAMPRQSGSRSLITPKPLRMYLRENGNVNSFRRERQMGSFTVATVRWDGDGRHDLLTPVTGRRVSCIA